MNNSLLIVLKKSGELVLRAKGHPAAIIATEIAVGFSLITKTRFPKQAGYSEAKEKIYNLIRCLLNSHSKEFFVFYTD